MLRTVACWISWPVGWLRAVGPLSGGWSDGRKTAKRTIWRPLEGRVALAYGLCHRPGRFESIGHAPLLPCRFARCL
eukprot:11763063-Alexandrium_andersonii.AAC.1